MRRRFAWACGAVLIGLSGAGQDGVSASEAQARAPIIFKNAPSDASGGGQEPAVSLREGPAAGALPENAPEPETAGGGQRPVDLLIPVTEGSGSEVPSAPGVTCNPSSPGSVHRIATQAIRYCGLIDAQGVQTFERELDTDVSDLVITSSGGTLDYPLRLADMVRARGLSVEIVGPCFSGCASLVFVAGSVRTLSKTALLGFHQTASSSALLFSRAGNAQSSDAAIPLYGRSQRELALYAAAGIDYDLLYAPQVLIETLCVYPASFDAQAGEAAIRIVSEFDLWVPTKRDLDRFGLAYRGTLPDDQSDIAKRYEIYMPSDVAVPKISLKDFRAEVSASRYLYNVKACALPEPGIE